MIPKILLIILIIRLSLKKRPLKPSFGILKYGDPYFERWSETLLKVTILESNRLTSTKAKCTKALDHVFGHCLHINNMENDAKIWSDLAKLSPFHVFCYTVMRRCLEVITLYLVRWLPLGCLFGFVSSSGALIWIYFRTRGKPKKAENVTERASELPFGLELAVGGIIDMQLADILNDDSYRILIEKVLRQYFYNTPSSVYDLFYFRRLRKTLFDFEKLGMMRSVPRNPEKKLLLQMRLSLMNVASFLVFAMVYLLIVMICSLLTYRIMNYLVAGISYRYAYARIESGSRKDKIEEEKIPQPANELQVGLARPSKFKDDEKSHSPNSKRDKRSKEKNSKREKNVCKPSSKQPSRNPSEISVKAETIKLSRKESHSYLPEVSQQKTENKTSQKEYADVGTYVCFDSEDSDQSDFEFLNYYISSNCH